MVTFKNLPTEEEDSRRDVVAGIQAKRYARRMHKAAALPDYWKVRWFIREVAASESEMRLIVAIYKSVFADWTICFKDLDATLQHALDLRAFPQLEGATPMSMNGETLYMQADGIVFHGALVTKRLDEHGNLAIIERIDFPQANNAVSQTRIYTHASTGIEYKVECYAWERGERAYNATFVNGRYVYGTDYTMRPTHTAAWVASAEAALRAALNTGENHVWAQVGAIPF